MNIALCISSQTIEAGGGYTFEHQLVKALLTAQANSEHTFILYVSDQQVPIWLSDSSLKIASLHTSFKDRIKLDIPIVVKAVLHKIRYPRSQFIVQDWREKYMLDSFESNNIDLILSFSPTCLTTEYPQITTIWDLQHKLQPYFPEINGAGGLDVRERFYKKMLKNAVFVITGTETGKAEIERFYQIPSERIKVIPFFTPQLTSSAALNNQDRTNKYNLPSRYLFYPAQFWSHKNHIGLLLAIKYLKDKYNLEFSLVLVGADKGNESYVREMIEKLDLSAQVHLLGFVPLEDMASLYRNAFALIFVTFFGPDNFPPLEAMALGCPVIASNVSGAKEQLGSSALLVDPRQLVEIAGAIKSLFEDDTLRENLIKSGLIKATQWTAKDYIKEVLSLIDDFNSIRRCWR
jgi:glycosyltransferase involved in cell wall biosynthesis